MFKMRSPDSRAGYRPGKTFEEELNLRYLSPGAFTVLAPEDHGSPPDPPLAPHPYRLSPAGKRNRNQAFSIIAEPPPRSRSPSPSGRVSPFRGRGFNPSGSRHASPAASPPPEDTRSRSINRKKSQIPKLKRRDSSVLSTEDEDSSPKFRRKNVSVLKPQLSKSLNYIGPKKVSSKPPISPRKFPSVVQTKGQVLNRLSPIIGSSPEPSSDSKSLSSPSRIPTKSRSTPPSRKPSPSRDSAKSRRLSRSSSRSNSRDSSPTKLLSPTRIPTRNYKNVQSKVNSYANKTKVPNNKTQENGNRVEDNNNERTKLKRNDSVKKSKPSGNKTNNVNNNNNVSTNNNNPSVSKSNSNNNLNKSNIKASNSTSNLSTINSNKKEGEVKTRDKIALIKAAVITKRATNAMKKSSIESKNEKSTTSKKPTNDNIKKVESASKLQDLLPSASTVVSSTTSTVTQPLKIEAKLDTPAKHYGTPTLTRNDEDKLKIKDTPMYMDEGRILSAKSVSSAIERMNDTVLDSQTLLKDHNLSKLTPSHPSASISHANENITSVSSAVPSVETVSNKVDVLSQNVNNSVSSVSNNIENNVRNSVNKVVGNEDNGGAKVNNYEMSANERIKEARTLVAADVKPIRIMVQEKPNNDDVQSGNVRFSPNATTNGTSTGAGAPPHPRENGSHEEIEEDKPKTRCGKFMEKCREKLTCTCCKTKPKQGIDKLAGTENGKTGCFNCLKRKNKDKEELEESDDDKEKKGCFPCLKRAKKNGDVEEVIVTNEDETAEKKKSCLDRLRCCRGNKIGDNSSDTVGCCGRSKKKKEKDSWMDRRDSILSDQPPLNKKTRCKNFFKLLFCCGCACCKRKSPPPPKVIEDSRRASLLSKKKSLTPTVLPPEEPKNKLDTSLVEYTSTMKAAIPVLPVALAYFCLFFNVFAPGTGTVFSGLFCLCMGIPRFSQKDSPKARFGSFIINAIIGCGQLFTVLFCLVGWGWSIWWGVIMIKVAKKHRKLKKIEARMEAQQEKSDSSTNMSKRDVEKGRS